MGRTAAGGGRFLGPRVQGAARPPVRPQALLWPPEPRAGPSRPSEWSSVEREGAGPSVGRVGGHGAERPTPLELEPGGGGVVPEPRAYGKRVGPGVLRGSRAAAGELAAPGLRAGRGVTGLEDP